VVGQNKKPEDVGRCAAVVYVMKCGCELARDNLEVIRNGGLRCPQHQGHGVEYIRKLCVDCGEPIKVSPNAPTTQRCEKCKKVRKRELNRLACQRMRHGYTEQDVAKRKKEDAAAKAWNCQHRGECLSAAITSYDKCLPCHECERYQALAAVV
jgi:hypothetical protein